MGASGRRAIIIIVSIGLVVVGLAWLGWATAEERTTTETVDGASSVQVRTESGDVEVVGTERTDVAVTVRARSGWLRQVSTEARLDDGVLVIDPECSGIPLPLTGCSADLSVEVPADLAVQVRVDSGDIRVRGLADDIDVRTSSGEVRAEAPSGRLRAESSSGSIQVSDLRSAEATLSTSSGDVEVTAAVPPRRLDAETSSGDVRLELPGGSPYALDAETSSGEETIGVATDPDSRYEVRAHTSSGDVEVTEAPGGG